jgi:hypothetical protein
MLREFAAAVVATALIAGPAFAAQSADKTGGMVPATPAAPSAQTSQTAPAASSTVKPTATVKQTQTVKHVRKHVARGKNGTMHQARHIKPMKTHQANVTKAAKHS